MIELFTQPLITTYTMSEILGEGSVSPNIFNTFINNGSSDGGTVVGGRYINPIEENVQIKSIALGSDLAIQGWNFTGTFSAIDSKNVAWTAGTLTFLDGASYSIVAGQTAY